MIYTRSDARMGYTAADGDEGGEDSTGKTKTSPEAGLCFRLLLYGTPDRTRTCAFGSGGQRSIH